MNKLFQRLGLAMRAGKLITGDELVLKAIRSGEAKLVLLAEDAAPNAKKKFTDKCRFYNVVLIQLSNRTELGRSIGKSDRVVIAVTDPGFAKMIQSEVKPTEVEEFE